MFHSQNILVLAPHTDDAELGCGGFIAKSLKKGDKVTIVNFSNAWQSLLPGFEKDTLIHEAKNAGIALGLSESDIYFYDFEVRKFAESRQDILDTLINLRQKLSPDTVLFPSSDDVHQDHQCINLEAKRAFKHSSCLGYELPWNAFTFRNDFYCQLTADEMSLKTEALKHYKSQAGRAYFMDDAVLSNAKIRGMQVNCDFAECFEVIRVIDR